MGLISSVKHFFMILLLYFIIIFFFAFIGKNVVGHLSEKRNVNEYLDFNNLWNGFNALF